MPIFEKTKSKNHPSPAQSLEIPSNKSHSFLGNIGPRPVDKNMKTGQKSI